MTIKVIQHKRAGKVEPVGGQVTHLYEGERIQHNFVNFSDRKEFLEKYNEIVKGLGCAHVIGIPDEYWKDKEIEANMFLCIYYGNLNELERCIILQNATIYVMQGGQTIDTIHC